MLLALLADTHGADLAALILRTAKRKPDLLIHAGDIVGHYGTRYGFPGDSDDRAAQAKRFLVSWNLIAERLPCPIVLIPGNHDFFLAWPQQPSQQFWSWDFHTAQRPSEVPPGFVPNLIQDNLHPNLRILNASGLRLGGLNLWGSPWTPFFNGWAYNFPPPLLGGLEDAKQHWAQVPADTDILITHGPPRGILDRNLRGEPCGCAALRAELDSGRIAPKVHVFGHIHPARGKETPGRTTFVNAAATDEAQKLRFGVEWVEV